jgi:RNA polymerase sigma factor (sigma-70 family)
MDREGVTAPSYRMAMPAVPTPLKARLVDPVLRRAVESAVRRRVRGDDADDVVQATYTDVLAARQLPEDEQEFRRFVFGVARNKVFDHFRRQRRSPEELSEDDAEGGEQPLSARDILRWAEGELPDSEAQDTLQWMLREGDGEKLEHIARDARVPAPRVRKRVSRLRKFLRERWAAELMLAGLVVLLGLLGALYYFASGRDPNDVVKGEPPRPAPSAPRAPLPRSEPYEPVPSLPAGETPELSPRAAPSSAPSALPAPSAKPTPAPRVKPAPKPTLSPKAAPRPLEASEAKPLSASDEVLGPTQMKAPAAAKKSKAPSKLDSDFFENKDQK